MQYDFTTSSSQAYGNNLLLMGTKFTIYSGDINQDEVIDASDMSEVDNDAYNSVSGYVRTDLTGDDFVDAQDLTLLTTTHSTQYPLFVLNLSPIPYTVPLTVSGQVKDSVTVTADVANTVEERGWSGH
ncbi:MAG: hypothetical protein IPJ45_09585 [Ignavibacteria bacterium]|nr:hypothetical protein [Ignavibacteria bacterium]